MICYYVGKGCRLWNFLPAWHPQAPPDTKWMPHIPLGKSDFLNIHCRKDFLTFLTSHQKCTTTQDRDQQKQLVKMFIVRVLVYMCMLGGVCVEVCMRVSMNLPQSHAPTLLFFIQISHCTSSPGWLSSEPPGSSCPPPTSRTLGLQVCAPIPRFFHLYSAPLACTASILPTELFSRLTSG